MALPKPVEILQIDEDMAYLFGVYLGDGSCFKAGRSYRVCLEVKDRDFVEHFAAAVKRVTGNDPYIFTHTPPLATGTIHRAVIGHKNLFMTLTRLTNNKKRIPLALWNAPLPYRLRFLEGLLDSEAEVMVPNSGVRQSADLRIRVCMTARWIGRLMHFVKDCGIRTGKWFRARETLSGKPFHGFSISAADFVRLGGTLHIARKQCRLVPPSQTGHGAVEQTEGTVEHA